MRLLLLASLLGLVGGCVNNATCKDNTMFLRLGWAGDATGADSVTLSITIGSDPAIVKTLTRPAGGDLTSVELDFGHYPTGQTVVVVATATKNGATVGTLSGSVVASGKCVPFDLGDVEPTDLGDDQGSVCGVGTHMCAGQCVANTPITSCGTSCLPCPVGANAVSATCDGTTCGLVCAPGFHLCGGQCVDDHALASCGGSCTPCPVGANATGATCDGTTCGLVCAAGNHLCAGQCVPNVAATSCGGSCTPCLAPTGGTAVCTYTGDGSDGQCGGTCPANQKLCAGACIPTAQSCSGVCPGGSHDCSGNCASNTSVNSCKTLCTACPVPQFATSATCDPTTGCGFVCMGGYKPCGGKCIPNSGCCVNTDCVAPSNGTVTCNTSTNQCVNACNSTFKLCNGACIPSSNCCAAGDCGNAPAHGSWACNSGTCTVSCGGGYRGCNNATCISTAAGSCCVTADCGGNPSGGTVSCNASNVCTRTCTTNGYLYCAGNNACQQCCSTGDCHPLNVDFATCDSSGKCGYGSCNKPQTCTCPTGMYSCTLGPQYGDCDGNLANGCETDFSVNGNCGACGVTCTGIEGCYSWPNLAASCGGSYPSMGWVCGDFS